MAEVKCPICGHVFDPQADQTYKDGSVTLVRGDSDEEGARRLLPKRLRDRLPRIVDVRCPNPKCKQTFEYNLDTNEVFNG